MPVMNDSTKAQVTRDFNGNVLAVSGGDQKPTKVVDTMGREITETPAEIATKTVEGEKTEQTEQVKNPEAEARKLYLSAQKAERKAKEMEKQAAAGLTKAQDFEKAVALAKSGEDPEAVAKLIGIDPLELYKKLTDYALRPDNKPEDPTQKALREHQERLDKYAKDLEVQAKTIEEKENIAAHNHAIMTHVVPLLTNNRDKYETLLTEYGNNAALQIYKEVYNHYEKTGETVSFERAADALEEYWYEQRKSAIIAASKLKKFKELFAQQPKTSGETSTDQSETPNRSTTLSNKQNTVSPPVANKPVKLQTREERIAAILAKY